MISIKRLIIIEVIIFIVAGLITLWVGEFTIYRFGTILLYCGIGAMAIAVVSQAGSRQRPMPYSYRPKISVSQQHQRDKETMQSESKFFLGAFLIGIIPVAVGLILKYLP
jgi:hypothetical protein